MPRSRHRVGRPYRTARKRMFAMYGTICHLCGHDGAGEADHLDPISLTPGQRIDPQRMRPAHGSNAPCPVCVGADGKPRACNQERGTKPIEALTTRRPPTSESW
jgi:hypothetical protein